MDIDMDIELGPVDDVGAMDIGINGTVGHAVSLAAHGMRALKIHWMPAVSHRLQASQC